MKILIAPNAFKNAASAPEVCESLRKGILEVLPGVQVAALPLADGGQGTVESLVAATIGHLVHVPVCDPLMREIPSFFGVTGDSGTAVIEMAAASGIELLSASELDPAKASTFGTGQLIRAALDEGCTKIILGIGGSATNDGGTGMATALGVLFLDANGRSVNPGGGFLQDIVTIDMQGIDDRIASAEILVACDVDNPLTGPEGASSIYGPQKGADPELVKILDRNLAHLAGKIREQLGRDIESVPGSGAAGGLGGGLMAFCGARLENGFEIISELTGLEEKIIASDLIITGEGRIDHQTQYGKTVAGVSKLAARHRKPVIAIAGTLTEDAASLYEIGIDMMLSILKKPVSLDEAIAGTRHLLELTGHDIARIIRFSEKLGG